MSSRILNPGEPRAVAPVVWRSAEAAAVAAAPKPAAAPPAPVPDAAAMAALERRWQEKVREAREAGLREGEDAGRSRAAAEIQPVIERLSRTIAEIAGTRAQLRREAESDMLQLAMAIARRVLRRELAVDPEALHGLALGALEKLEAQEIARVRLHPSQAAAVSALLRQENTRGTVEVIPDAALDPGAAIFETSRGNLDASVETQLREIERGLADCLRRRG
ncbi:MAG TPA: FliH/SctL family protein [Bryobacteraceae bacterium]|nr:FliH/SctL family protein [Bryobacteraceae bacterium]